MRKSTVILLAASLFTASVPAMAMTHADTRSSHDVQCQKDCEMQIRNCATEVESLQQRISNLEAAIKDNAGKYSNEQLSKLKSRLEDAEKTLAEIQRGA